MRILESMTSMIAGSRFHLNNQRSLNSGLHEDSSDAISFNFDSINRETTNDHPLVNPNIGVSTYNSTKSPRPLIIWHGLGDSYNSEAMYRVFEILRLVVPDLYIYSVFLDEDTEKDAQKSMFANMNEELDAVCERVLADPVISMALKNQHDGGADSHSGVNMIGFSQGGLFSRSLIERCEGLNNINNLITFGLPHNGILDLPECGKTDWVCHQRNKFVKGHIWDKNIQQNVVFAQYFRNGAGSHGYNEDYEKYLENSIFLKDVNNEGEKGDEMYKKKLTSINGKFVMVRFEKDKVVVPRDSAWFSDWQPKISKNEDHVLIPLIESRQFREDLIGLQEMLNSDKLVFESINGEHMSISEGDLEKFARAYLT